MQPTLSVLCNEICYITQETSDEKMVCKKEHMIMAKSSHFSKNLQSAYSVYGFEITSIEVS